MQNDRTEEEFLKELMDRFKNGIEPGHRLPDTGQLVLGPRGRVIWTDATDGVPHESLIGRPEDFCE